MVELDADATAQALPWEELLAALERTLAAWADGAVRAPLRQRVDLPGGATLLAMPAADEHLAVLKTVTVHPANRGSTAGAPVVQSDLLVIDARTGARLARLDGDTLTARRTAALSLLAARRAGIAPASLLVVGSGTQAAAHVAAFVEAGGLREVRIAARNPRTAAALALATARLGAHAVVVDDLAAAVRTAPLIVTATTAVQPVLPDELGAGALVCAVGSYSPGRAELPASLVRRAQVVVDTLEGCRAEAGDLLQAQLAWEQVIPLHALTRAAAGDAPIVFKSVGCAAWDLAAAHCWAAGGAR